MLKQRLLGYLAYFESLAMQPPNRWDGFYLATDEEQVFALRHQIAFACYALGALCLHAEVEPGDKQRCHTAMAALIERMLQRRVWAYWAKRAEQTNDPPDPIERANLSYSGHLAMMISVYELVGGDSRYDEPFTLLWTGSERFAYTHTTITETIWNQMRMSKQYGAIESTPGQIVTVDMCYALWSNVLHDGIHGSDYATINETWLAFVQQRMILWGPRFLTGGIISPGISLRTGIPWPLGQTLVDAQVLTLLSPLVPDFVDAHVISFFKIVQQHPEHADYSYIPPERGAAAKEYSDDTLPTGFAAVLATQLGKQDRTAAMLRYADHAFQPTETDQGRSYRGGLSSPYTTALFALAEAGGFSCFCNALRWRQPAAPRPLPPLPTDDLDDDGIVSLPRPMDDLSLTRGTPMNHIPINDMMLHFHDCGNGPPMLLIHAFPLSSAMWLPQIDSFTNTHRLIVPDLRGFGRSESAAGPPMTMEMAANDLIALLDELGLEQVIVGGVSMGGYLAFALVRQAPERIRALILSDTRATPDSDEARAGRETTARLAETQGAQAIADAMIPKLLRSTATDTQRTFVRSIIEQNSPHGIAAALRGMAQRSDSTSLLPSLHIPTLLICGQDDPLTPPHEMRTLHETIPGSYFVEIPDAAHLPNLEQPDAFNQALATFLEIVPPPTTP